MKRVATSLAALALLVAAGQAVAAEKSIVIGVGLMHGTADLASSGTVGGGLYSSAFQTPELGGRFEYWNMMKENYALNFAANWGFSSETDKPNTTAPPNSPDLKFTTSSWSVRLGGDRVWSPLPNTKVFVGPGIEYWSGKAKFEGFASPPPPTTYETQSTSRISLAGHTGAMMFLGSNWGLSGQLGHKIGYASYEEKGGKVTWWPTSVDGAMELIFSFGGK
jgi:opacity protein-like surface antigen